ncbi:type II toxin-antitoxin system ParD family antitoxin [Taklimakanibacter lacteus]|uniref:type II toxin-antitoxin system ParD family antitoxin n=1 Tax=Taklimakanibacter lacteus TaxID=2268456 RepID=UPI000E667216
MANRDRDGKQTCKGRVRSASKVARAALQLLDKPDWRMSQLRSALKEGEAGGEPVPFDMEEFIAEKKSDYAGRCKST